MTVQIKICGIKTHEALQAALQGGADYFGLVFYAPSPRNVTEATARALVEAAGAGAKSVALLVDPSDEDVRRVSEAVAPDYIQLHGQETPARVAEIRKLCGHPLIKAVHIADPGDSDAAAAYAGLADIILYDAKPAADASDQLPGGNGVPFDWRLLSGIKQSDSFMLSGGLSPDNVAQAIGATHAPMVDVSSGVERAPGEKDPDLIRQFIERAKSAAEV
jgi:phosphoribosylanthranilate isomerase